MDLYKDFYLDCESEYLVKDRINIRILIVFCYMLI